MAFLTSSGFDAAGFGATADLIASSGWFKTDGQLTDDINWHATDGKFGGGCLKIIANSTDGTMTKRFPAFTTEFFRLAFYVYIPSGYTCSSQGLVWFTDAAQTTFLNMYVNSSGFLTVGDTFGSKSVAGATGTVDIQDDAWHHIEVEFTRDASAGAVKMWVDGTLDINVSGTNTGSLTLIGLDTIHLSNSRSSGGVVDYVRFDDVVLWDDSGTDGFTGQIGAHRIYGLTVDGAGASTQFTPSAGSNYLNVDEASVDLGTTYNESATSGHKDLYTVTTMGSIAAQPATDVWGVVVKTCARATNVGGVSIKNVISDGTTEVQSAAKALTIAHAEHEFCLPYDPGTGAVWVDTDIADVQIGLEVV